MLLLPLSVLLLLTQPWRSLGAEMKIYSQKTLANACTLVMCSPLEGSLPGRDGQDGREGPQSCLLGLGLHTLAWVENVFNS